MRDRELKVILQYMMNMNREKEEMTSLIESKYKVDRSKALSKYMDSLVSKFKEEEKQPPKLCRDCKHLIRVHQTSIAHSGFLELDHAKCAASNHVDLVTGEIKMHFCSTYRGNECGPEGKLWEAKE